jgi:PadR family transcriptional regulator PadR
MYHTVCAIHYMAHTNNDAASPLENLRLELRRGCLVLAVLAALRTEQYGYTLRKALADRDMEIDEGTLYPLLRRLETQGLLVSHWREEDKRNKRFYRLSPEGKKILKQLLAEWNSLNSSLDEILKESHHGTY